MLLQLQVWALLLLQEGGAEVGFDFRQMWDQMGFLAKAVVVMLFIMSVWSIGIMIDRFLMFSAAKSQSREFAPAVAGALKNNNLDEAVKIADRFKKSHLAKVVVAGLQEFRANGGEVTEQSIDSCQRALERAEAITKSELKKGIGSLATIGSVAPFVGLFGTTVGIVNAFKGIATQKSAGLGAVAGGISEALVTTAIGLFVAIPAVMVFNYFAGRLETFDIEMANSTSELVDYFIKRSNKVRS